MEVTVAMLQKYLDGYEESLKKSTIPEHHKDVLTFIQGLRNFITYMEGIR